MRRGTIQAGMMAYLKYIPKHKCLACGQPALVELFNHSNTSIGYYCRSCGKRELRQMKESEGQKV